MTIDITASPYFADHTGFADATQRIQAALDAWTPGDTVYIPRGTFRLVGQLFVKDKIGLNIQGQGPGMSIIFADDPAHPTGKRSMLVLKDCEHCRVAGVVFDARFQPTVQCCVLASGGHSLLFLRNDVRNLVWRSCFLDVVAPWGIRLSEGTPLDASEADLILANRFYRIGTQLASGAPASAEFDPADTFVGGVAVNTENRPFIRIQSNRIAATGRAGIGCKTSKGVYIAQNKISFTGVVQHTDQNDLSIELFEACHRSRIEFNQCDHRISLDGTSLTVIAHNRVGSVPTTRFIGLENARGASKNIWIGNVVDGSVEYGFSVSNVDEKCYVAVIENILQRATKQGVNLQAESETLRDFLFERNYIRDNGSANSGNNVGGGIRMRADDAVSSIRRITFRKNHILKNYAFAVMFAPDHKVDKLWFDDDTITGTAGGMRKAFETSLINHFTWTNALTPPTGYDDSTIPTGLVPSAATISVAGFSYAPIPVLAGQSVTFTSTSMNQTAPITYWLWDFGFGGARQGGIITVTFPEAGTYRVTLIVFDDTGSTRDSQLVNVL